MDKRQIIAIEIGSSAVKKIHIELENDCLAWTWASLIEVQSKEESARKKETVAAILEILKETDDSGHETLFVFNSPQSFVRELYLPKMPGRELDQAIQIQLKKEIPFAVEEANIGYQVVEIKPSAEGTRLRILASAVSQKILDEKLALLKEGGFSPRDTLHTPFSIQKFAPVAGIKEDEVAAVMDIGAAITSLNIYEGCKLKFTRKIQVGGDDITALLLDPGVIERMGLEPLNPQDAEKLKKVRGLLSSHPSDASMPEGFKPVQFLAAARPVLERFQNEVTRSFNYFSEQSNGKAVNRVLLSGGGGELKGLKEFLEKRLQMPVQSLEIIPNSQFQIGEAIKAKQDDMPRYHRMVIMVSNFLEKKKPFAWLSRIPKEQLIKGGAVFFSVFFAVVWTQFFFQGHKISSKTAAMKEIAAAYEKAKEIKTVENDAMDRQAEWDAFFVREPYWEDAFMELTNLLPSNFYLETIEYKENIFTITGTYTQENFTEDKLTGFLTALCKGVFSKAKLVSTKEVEQGSGIFRFEIKCKV